MDKKNLGQKLVEMRVELQKMDLKKSGHNTYAGYRYFELGDFLPAINELALKYKICTEVNFYSDRATLTIENSENLEEKKMFECTTGDIQLKGCHDIQNVGAVQTYLRRYLYTNAFEIVEQSELDAVTCKPTPKNKQSNNITNTTLQDDSELKCSECNIPINQNVYTFSINRLKRALCIECQKKFKEA